MKWTILAPLQWLLAMVAVGLGTGLDIDRALELAAGCGASCLTGKGPYGNQLTLA